MKRIPPPRSGLVKAMHALNVTLDRAQELSAEMEAFQIEAGNFRFLKIKTEKPRTIPPRKKLRPAIEPFVAALKSMLEASFQNRSHLSEADSSGVDLAS